MKSIMDEKDNIYSTIKKRDHLDKMYLVICKPQKVETKKR